MLSPSHAAPNLNGVERELNWAVVRPTAVQAHRSLKASSLIVRTVCHVLCILRISVVRWSRPIPIEERVMKVLFTVILTIVNRAEVFNDV